MNEDTYYSPTVGKLATALVKARRAMGAATKSATNPHFKTKYADLAAVVEACMEHLLANGIVPLQQSEPTHDGVLMRTTLLHESGEWVASKLFLPATKQDPQAYGSAITYARRYGLAAIVCLATEDDDGEAMRTPAPVKAGIPGLIRTPMGDPAALEVKFVAAIHAATTMAQLRQTGMEIGSAHKGGQIDDARRASLMAAYTARQAELTGAK